MFQSRKNILVGIDPGVNTGLAVYNQISGQLDTVLTCDILAAMETIDGLVNQVKQGSYGQSVAVILYVENPNLRTFFGKTGREVLQGAGSVKRDFSIWETYAQKRGLQLVGIHPKNSGGKFEGKAGAELFKKVTGWQKLTSTHARQAAALVYAR
jgi:hypothetical protein